MRSFSSRQVNLRRTEPPPRIIATTDELGWSSMYSAVLHEIPHHHEYEGIPHLWLSTVPNEATLISSVLGGKRKNGPLPPGSICLSYNHGPAIVTLDNHIELHHGYVRTQVVEEVASTLFKGDPKKIELEPVFGGDDPMVSLLLANVRHAMAVSKSYSGQLFSDYLARALTVHLLKSYSTRRDLLLPPTQIGRFSRWKSDDLVEYMRAHMARDISIEELATVTHRSPTHFARTFKATFNCTPHAFLTRLRIERARELLTSSILPIGQIATLCGFPSHSHFSAVFRHHVGLTPLAYRNSLCR